MTLKNTFYIAASSYFAMGCAIVASLITIRLATRALSTDEFGLWSFTFQSIGYFLLLDFGVSSALGRMFGEPLATGDREVISGWFSLSTLILITQGGVILLVGLLLRDSILSWFRIPENLRETATNLWTWLLCIQAAGVPFRVTSGLLHAENRGYVTNFASSGITVIALGVFWVLLRDGRGVMAYAYSAAVQTGLQAIAGALAVAFGPNRPRLRLTRLPFHALRSLFAYSLGSFFVGIAVQVSFASQTLILTRMLGLDAAAMFNVTSRMAMLIMQAIWKPFDAFAARWQVALCAGDNPRVVREFAVLFRATWLIAVAAFCGIVLANPAFVRWWTRPEFFGGYLLNLMICGYVLLQVVMHCYSFAFGLHRRMFPYAWVVAGHTALEITLSIIGVKLIGLAGIPAGCMAAFAVLNGWYILIQGARLLENRISPLLRADWMWWLPAGLLAGFGSLWFSAGLPMSTQWQFVIAAAAGSVLAAPLMLRAFRLFQSLRTL